MTWNSGRCAGSPFGGTAWISTDGAREPVRVDGADVRADDIELDRELFVGIAETHPGIVRTLGVLMGELADLGDLDPSRQRRLGDRIRLLGQAVIMRADRIVVDPT